VVEEAPAEIDTLAGTGSAVALLLDRATGNPAVAALFSVTVQVVAWPESSVVGEHARVLSTTGAGRVSVKFLDPPLAEAVTRAVSSTVTEAGVAVKAAVVAEAATVTDAGRVTLALPLARATATPPAGAAADSVTVQLEVPGAVTVEGVQVKPLTEGSGPTVIAEVLETPLADADTDTAVLAPTVAAVAVKVVEEAPAEIDTLAGTGSAVALLLRRATGKEAVAALFSVTVQVVA
jgi:hypothetical protein